MNKQLLTGKRVSISLLLLCLTQPVLADQTWRGATDNQWATTGNWSGNALPGSTDLVIYNATSTANLSNSLSQIFSIKGIVFSNAPGAVSINSSAALTNGAGGINMTNVSQSLTIAAPFVVATNQSWNVASNQSLTISGVVSGAGGIFKDAFGTLFLNGANTFTGSLTNNGGQIWISNSAALGVGPKTITIANNNVGAGLHLNGVNGNITLANNISWVVSDNLGVIVNEAGSNTINGPMSVFSGGGAPYFVANAGTLVLNGAITLGTTARPMTLGGSATGIDSGGIGSAGLALQKVDSGIWTLTAKNGYGGVTTITGGTLALGPGGTFTNTPSITVSNNCFLDVSAVTNAAGSNAFVLSPGTTNQILAGSGTVIGNVSNLNATAIQPGGNFAVGTLTFSNNLSLNSNATNYFELNTANTPGSGVNDLIAVGGSLDPRGASIYVTALSPLTPGSYTLFNYGGSYVSTFSSSIFSDSRYTFSLDDLSTPGQINVTVGGNNANLVWSGNNNTTWDFNNTPNWNTGTLSFLNADNVTFDDTGVSPTVALNGSLGPLRPGSVTVNSSSNYVFSAVNGGKITGLAGITKSGSGILSNTVAACDFVGPITVNGGVFSVSLPTAANAANAGTACVLGAGTNITLNGGTFQSTAASTVSFNRLFTLGASGGAIDTPSATLSINNQISGPGSLTKTGSKQLILGGITTGALSPLASNSFAGNLLVNAGEVQLRNSYAIGAGKAVVANAADLAVGGGANYGSIFGNIDLNGDGNGNGALQVNDANTQASFVGAINLVTASSVGTVNNGSVVTFTIAGPVIGSGALKKLGTNTVTLTGTNTYGGGTLISSGTLQLGGGAVCGTLGSGLVTNNSALAFNHTDTLSVANSISGTGTLTHKGSGTLTLAGANTYTGTTTVSGGTVLVSGSLGTNTVTVANNATLGGASTIGGAVTVQNGGTLALGSSIATLAINNTLNFSSTSTNTMKLSKTGSTLSNDLITGVSTLTFNGRLNVTASGAALAAGDTFQLFSASSYSGAFASTNLPALGANLAWDTSNLGTGTLKVLSTLASPPQITSGTRLGNGTFQLVVSGTSGFGYRIWGATNVTLKPVTNTWTQLTNGTFSASPVIFTDLQATNFSRRFYEVTIP